MLRQIAIFLLVPILILPGVIPDDFSSTYSSLVPAQISSDNNFEPDRNLADIVRMLIVQIILVISFLISIIFLVKWQGPPITGLHSRAPPFSR